MKLWDKVSSFRGANTLLQGPQINGHRGDRRENTQREGDHRGQINRQIKAADPRRDQHRSQKTRPQEIKGPEQRNQNCSEIQSQRV
jgi:hypothetical protein